MAKADPIMTSEVTGDRVSPCECVRLYYGEASGWRRVNHAYIKV